jgi:hypothetical protein
MAASEARGEEAIIAHLPPALPAAKTLSRGPSAMILPASMTIRRSQIDSILPMGRDNQA